MHQSLIGASLILEKSQITNIQHACLQDSLTAEDFAYSEGLPGNKNNYTLTYRWAKRFYNHAPNPYIVIVQKIKVYPDNVKSFAVVLEQASQQGGQNSDQLMQALFQTVSISYFPFLSLFVFSRISEDSIFAFHPFRFLCYFVIEIFFNVT